MQSRASDRHSLRRDSESAFRVFSFCGLFGVFGLATQSVGLGVECF